MSLHPDDAGAYMKHYPLGHCLPFFIVGSPNCLHIPLYPSYPSFARAWVSARMLRDSSHTVAVANISVGCAKTALLRTPGHLCSNLGTDLPPHTIKWVPIHGTSHGTPVPKKCRKGDQLREVTFVCLCVGVSVSCHTAVPMATELQKWHFPCYLLFTW